MANRGNPACALAKARRITTYLVCAIALQAWFTSYSQAAPPYAYPIQDPYAATIIGTPSEFRADVVPLKQIRWRLRNLEILPEDTPLPESLWYASEFTYSYSLQKKPAPLIFIIAGTGASHTSEKVLLLQRMFHAAGFHAVGIPSPTYSNFIITALPSHFPGYIPDDTRALYQVMQKIDTDLKQSKGMEVTEYHLTGYSLGGTHSAFVSHIDEQEKAFDFQRVLLLNPAVSLYNSTQVLDSYIEDMTMRDVSGFVHEVFSDVASTLGSEETEIALSDPDFIYQRYLLTQPDDLVLERLIGIAFRLSAMNLAYVSDVMNNVGYVTAKNQPPAKYEDTLPYFLLTAHLSFIDYFDKMLLPDLLRRYPELDRDTVLRQESLHSIADYLAGSDKIGLITNADDIILNESDVDFLRRTFGNRGKIFPYGGHMGNMAEREYVSNVIWFFQRGRGTSR